MTGKRGEEVKKKGRQQIEKPTGLERILDIWKRYLDSAAFRTWDELQSDGICGSAAVKEDLVPTSRVK